MAVAFRAKAEAVQAAAANITIDKPTGTVNDDIMVAVLYVENDVAVTAPGGWALLTSVDHPSVAFDGYWYWKRASGEGASYTWTHSSAYRTGYIVSCSGCVTGVDPFDGATTGTATGTDATAECTSVTLTETDSLLLATAVYWSDRSSTAPGGSPTFTERVDPGNNIYLATASATASGATGTKTITPASAVEWASLLLALRSQVTAAGAASRPVFPPPRRVWRGRLVK